MDAAEWESLCDGCARCCLLKLSGPGRGEVHYTQVHCQLLDADTCRCRDYDERLRRVADCVQVSTDPQVLAALPRTCAYRRLAEGRGLAWWHPLVSGDPDSVHRAGVSVRARTQPQSAVHPGELGLHIVEWPHSEPPASGGTRARRAGPGRRWSR